MNKCKDKKCPREKICNPVSGRCVKKSGKLGQIALALKRKERSRSKSKSMRKSKSRSKVRSKSRSKKVRSKVRSKACPSGKIRNPKTGRCVKKTGAIGRKLLMKSKSRKPRRKSVKKVKSRRRKSDKKSKQRRSRKSRKTKMQKFVEEQLEKRKNCKNPTNLLGEETKDMDPKKLYVSPSGYCYHINDDLVPHLLKSPKPDLDPFTNVKMWKDSDDFRKTIYNHPGLNKDGKRALFKKFLKPKTLTSKELLFCIQYAPIFKKIGELGLTMWSDYSKGFKASLRELAATKSMIDEMPEADKKFLMKMKPKQLRSKSLKSLFSSISTACIHGMGATTLEYYFYYVHTICSDWAELQKTIKTERGKKLLKEYENSKYDFCNDSPFPGIYNKVDRNMSIVTYLIPGKLIDLFAYKYDKESSGRYSFATRFARIRTNLRPKKSRTMPYFHYESIYDSRWNSRERSYLENYGKNTEKDLEKIKREPESVKHYIKKYIKVSEGSESGWENA